MNIQTAKKEKIRDPRWLRLEVCRDYTRDNKCDQGLEQCRFAHPGKNCVTTNGKVTACYDSMKGRCSRESCKFYHPPDHIKKNIQALGKALSSSVCWKSGVSTISLDYTHLCSCHHLTCCPLSNPFLAWDIFHVEWTIQTGFPSVAILWVSHAGRLQQIVSLRIHQPRFKSTQMGL